MKMRNPRIQMWREFQPEEDAPQSSEECGVHGQIEVKFWNKKIELEFKEE